MNNPQQRPSLKQFHARNPWLDDDYQERYDHAKEAGDFSLGMKHPLRDGFMYDSTAIDNLHEKYYFCFDTADMVIDFIETCLTHSKPHRFAKFPLHYSQSKFFRNLFGWKKKSDGFRRFREGFKYIPRKNSKSWDQGCICHIGMILDGEDGTEIYNIASNKDQAKKVFDPFVASIKNDEERPEICAGGLLANYYNIIGRTDVKAVTANNELDVCKPVANDELALHGTNTHMAILDELHAFRDGGVYEVMITSMSVRDQPLIICITTSDYAKESMCNTKFDYARRVCEDPRLDPRFLPVLYYADPDEFGDDWQCPEVWARVNPMLGVAKKMEYMEDMHRKAVNDATFTNTFKRLELNICTMSENSAFNVDKWRKCKMDSDDAYEFTLLGQPIPEELKGAVCYAGMDNAYKHDLNSLVLDFLDTDYVLNFNWVPREHSDITKLRNDYGDYLLTAGDKEIDFDEIYEHMQLIFEQFDVQEIAFDPNKSWEIRKRMSADYDDAFICTMAQRVSHLSEPLKKIIGEVNNLKIKHTGNPLFTWQVSSCDIKEDRNNDFMIVKPKGVDSKGKKVDACVAWVMARGLRMQAEEEVDYLGYIS